MTATTTTTTAPQAFNTLADIKLAAAKAFELEPAAQAIGYNFNLGGGKVLVVWVDRAGTTWDRNPAEA